MFYGFRASRVFKNRRRLYSLDRKRVIGSSSRSCVKNKKCVTMR